MRQYSSKEEIYEDFNIAVKFHLKFDVSPEFYYTLYRILSDEDEWKVRRFERDVRLLRKQHDGRAIGAFVEVPVTDDSGRTLGSRCVLLGHESGPEWWGMVGGAAGIALPMIWDLIKERTLYATRKWLIESGYKDNPIWYVELRTYRKGVMRIDLEDLRTGHLKCMAEKFDHVDHIAKLNHSCFDGKLYESDPDIDDDGI